MSDREESAEVQSESASLYGAEAERYARVVRAIEGEIIPRFLMSFAAPLQRAYGLEWTTSHRREDVDELARLLLSDDTVLAGAFIQGIRREKVPLDQICVELLAPAAHRLRALWERNECDLGGFVMGVERLLNVLQFVTEAAADECS